MHKLDNLPKAIQFVSGGTGIGSQIVRDKSPAVVTMLWKFPINKHDCIEILHLHFGGIPPFINLAFLRFILKKCLNLVWVENCPQFKKET